MLKVSLRSHPDVIFAYSQNYVDVIMRIENHSANNLWCEADIKTPENISLSPTNDLRKGRVRVGILTKKEFIEKSVRVFANQYTSPQMYQLDITLYAFNKDGIIDTRLEKKTEVRCELKKEEKI